ncbi:hypothetical protein [Martelella alba]|uniref:Uncharacterized protein n=1 Tax=Martelella alba TaxID=2590451 RepID=A0ABY2SIE4_9HYPH|nr:hypothetical protein [Martelella alba]TKI05132.1 hypothetical protein FCN80_15640 [Martelella alba]
MYTERYLAANSAPLGQARPDHIIPLPYQKPLPIRDVHNYALNSVINGNAKPRRRTRSKTAFLAAEEKKIDALYQCRNELLAHRGTIIPGQEVLLMRIEDERGERYAPVRPTTLPSGKVVYLGDVDGRLLVTDGDYYHIENLVESREMPLLGQFICLAAQVLGVVGLVALHRRGPFPAFAETREAARGNRDFSAQGIAGLGRRALDATIQFGRAALGFTFPPVAAALRRKGGGGHPVWWKRQRSPRESHRGMTKEIGCALSITLPDPFAREMHEKHKQTFNLARSDTRLSLEWLVDFDGYLAKNLTDDFDQALFLGHKRETVHLILEKKYLENAINLCLNVQSSWITPKSALDDKLKKRIFIDQLFEDLLNTLRKAVEKIKFKTLREAVTLKNGLSFDEAKYLFIENSKKEQNMTLSYWLDYHDYILLMQQAHHDYCQHLQYDQYATTLERVLYQNNIESYDAILRSDEKKFTIAFIKRFFYYIFEYNHNNNISIHGNIFMVPGEFTEYWQLFSERENLIDIDTITKICINEFDLYFSEQEQSDTRIQRLTRLMDFSRTRIVSNYSEESWNYRNLWPILKTQEILDHYIETTIDRENDERVWTPNQWINSLDSLIKYDAECLLLLQYLLRLQQIMNANAQLYMNDADMMQTLTDDQKIIQAKLIVAKRAWRDAQLEKNNNDYFNYYNQHVGQGNLDLYIAAATYWYLAQQKNLEYALSHLDVLYVIKSYNKAELLQSIDFQSRGESQYTSIFSLARSGEFIQQEEYYRQFIEYNVHDKFFEARNMTCMYISKSPFGFIDLIFKPKHIYTFKVYSRHYIKNPIATGQWVSSPASNFGHITLLYLHDNRMALISTLLSAPFIFDMSLRRHLPVLHKLEENWRKTHMHLHIRNRKKIAINFLEMCNLLNFDENYCDDYLEFLIKKPEDNRIENPAPEYYFVADLCKGEMTSVLLTIDCLNEELLAELSQAMKERLRDRTWVNNLVELIPFYEVLWNYWHDEEYEVQFKDILFDSFDLIFSLISIGKSLGRLSYNTLYRILLGAKSANIPRHVLNTYILRRLVVSAPGFLADTGKIISLEMISYINPIPVFLPTRAHIEGFLKRNTLDNVDWVNNHLSDKIKKREKDAKKWSLEVDRDLLTPSESGIFTVAHHELHSQKYIAIDGNFYQVIRDDMRSLWRIIKSMNVRDINYAIPVQRNKKGIWTSAAFRDSDPVSLLDLLTTSVEKPYINLRKMKFEPMRDIEKNITRLPEHGIILYRLRLFSQYYQSWTETPGNTISALYIYFSRFFKCLTEEVSFDYLIGRHISIMDRDRAILYVNDFSNKYSLSARYRIIWSWSKEYDFHPMQRVVLVLHAAQRDYVLDLDISSPSQNVTHARQRLLYESQWLVYYLRYVPQHHELIKYKDFVNQNEMTSFDPADAFMPGKYMADTYIIKEPFWYKAASIKFQMANQPITGITNYNKDAPILITLKAMVISQDRLPPPTQTIDNSRLFITDNELSDRVNFHKLQHMLARIVSLNLPLSSYSHSSAAITHISELLRVSQGKFLAILSENGVLKHLLLSLGLGRYAGLGNNFFAANLPVEPSIISCDELGDFKDQRLSLFNSNRRYKV